MLRVLLALAVLWTALPSRAYADSWKVLGPRPLGMGGAFVAMAEGGLAQYWNPAGLAQDAAASKWGAVAGIGGRAEFTGGILNDANTLGDLASKFSTIKDAQTSGTNGAVDAEEVGAFYKSLATIAHMNEPGKGVIADIHGGVDFRFSKVAVSLNNFTSIGGAPFVDLQNIGLGASGSLSGVQFNNVTTTYCGGATCANAPANASNAASAASITAALGASGFAGLDALMGGELTANGVNAGNVGNVLVNMSVQNGSTPEQIAAAAADLSASAGTANPLISGAASGSAYTNNQSNLTLRGASFTELAFGYGQKFFLPGLYAGANLKLISGEVGYARYRVLENSAGDADVLEEYDRNTANSIQPGIDVGFLWKVHETLPVVPLKPRVGIVARNINNPKFKQPDLAKTDGESRKYPLNGQMRAGLAVSPLSFWNVALDVDLTKNNTPLPGYQSRMFGLGTEVNVFNRSWINIPLRAGIMKNMADSASKTAYTFGLGLNFLHFMLDLGGAVSSDRTTIDSGEEVPSNASVAVQLGFLF